VPTRVSDDFFYSAAAVSGIAAELSVTAAVWK
jgi:hypothetical protein